LDILGIADLMKLKLKIMLACDSEEEFLDCSMSITSMWSEPSVSYFERQLKSDIIKYAGKWLFLVLGTQLFLKVRLSF
jgi:hypothetical protein